jgi:hypothetical protein
MPQAPPKVGKHYQTRRCHASQDNNRNWLSHFLQQNHFQQPAFFQFFNSPSFIKAESSLPFVQKSSPPPPPSPLNLLSCYGSLVVFTKPCAHHINRGLEPRVFSELGKTMRVKNLTQYVGCVWRKTSLKESCSPREGKPARGH